MGVLEEMSIFLRQYWIKICLYLECLGRHSPAAPPWWRWPGRCWRPRSPPGTSWRNGVCCIWSGHRLYGPWELIELHLSVMFHNNITASFRFDTMELSWTVSGSSIYWNINAPRIIGLRLYHHHYHDLHHYHRTGSPPWQVTSQCCWGLSVWGGVRRGQSSENTEQDTRKRVNVCNALKLCIVQAGCHFSFDPSPRSDDRTSRQPPVIQLRHMSRMWRPDWIS